MARLPNPGHQVTAPDLSLLSPAELRRRADTARTARLKAGTEAGRAECGAILAAVVEELGRRG